MIWLIILATVIILSPWVVYFFQGKDHALDQRKINLDLTIIIPFRNEVDRLPELIASLEQLQDVPVLFINDHSEDEAAEIIKSTSANKVGWKLLQLGKDETGKKAAILIGLTHAKTAYVLTLDADVTFNADLLIHTNIPADLIIRPVRMKGYGFLSRIFAMEYNLFNALNFLFYKNRPVSASGANLLVKRALYLEQLQNDQKSLNFSSGDDYFLLHYAQNKGKSIYLDENKSSFVNTSAPETIKAYFQQRCRWLSKTWVNLNFSELIIGAWATLYTLLPLIAVVAVLSNFIPWYFLMTFPLRIAMDLWLLRNYAPKTSILTVVFFTLIHPFLFLVTIIASRFIKPKWKGRAVVRV